MEEFSLLKPDVELLQPLLRWKLQIDKTAMLLLLVIPLRRLVEVLFFESVGEVERGCNTQPQSICDFCRSNLDSLHTTLVSLAACATSPPTRSVDRLNLQVLFLVAS